MGLMYRWTVRKQCMRGVDWIHLIQDRDQWWALVNINDWLNSIKGREFPDQLREC
jgi:hypothetical protein